MWRPYLSARGDQAAVVRRWLALAYGGDLTGSLAAARSYVAVRMLRDAPALAENVWGCLCRRARPRSITRDQE